jgi:hypothetical protein
MVGAVANRCEFDEPSRPVPDACYSVKVPMLFFHPIFALVLVHDSAGFVVVRLSVYEMLILEEVGVGVEDAMIFCSIPFDEECPQRLYFVFLQQVVMVVSVSMEPSQLYRYDVASSYVHHNTLLHNYSLLQRAHASRALEYYYLYHF